MGRRQKGRIVHGILLLDKSTGSSSNHQLQKAKRLYDARKAGHTGSLDPLATGMLPICFGEATKISAWLLDADKTYLTDARLGVCTDSADADGQVIREREVPDLDDTTVEATVQKFTGQSQQVPPMYSAIKVDGQRLYKLAREGKTVERKPRAITVFGISVVARQGSLLSLRVHCSKGTYIRTLVEAIGEALGCGAHVETLRRESVTPFGQMPMHSLQALEGTHQLGQEALDGMLLPMDCAMQHLSSVEISTADAALFCQGRVLQGCGISHPQQPEDSLKPGEMSLVRVYSDSKLVGVARFGTEAVPGSSHQANTLQPSKVFNWH